MPSLEIEGPDTGWIASVRLDDQGEVRVAEAREGWLEAAQHLLARVLEEPSPSGRIPGALGLPFDEDVLYEVAASLMRRKPLLRGERVTGYVSGGSRFVDTPDTWDE